ncbi:RING-H2 finger protein ATL65 [Iris pallida]|uniref:RING-type E3 ubiquitin transferase n=1 Tax=Iris pallida TaxID=29817 RepID=A0AAX6FJQ8_IRIPA|nr:RING-H2 finger protein ATL65 [Iris pallida]
MAAPARSTPFEFEWAPTPLPTATVSGPSPRTSTQFSPPLIAMVAVIGTAAIIVLYARLLHRRFRRWRRRRLLLLLSDDPGSPPPNFSSDDDHYFFSPYYGLDDLSISSLPLSIYSSRVLEPSGKLRECAVCLLEFADGDRLRSLPLCSHHFHVGCIDVWLRSHATCPLCRSGVFVPMRASRIRPSLDDMILPDVSAAEPEISAATASPAPPYRDFLLKRSYSFGFERDVSVSASATSPWRYRHGGRGFWSKRFPSPFVGGIGGGSRVFSFRANRGKRRGFFALGGGSAATVGPSWRRSRAMTSPSAVFLRSVAAVGPAVGGFGSSRMRCGDPEALLSPERLQRR